MAVVLAFCGARPNWAKTVPVGQALADRGYDVRYFDLRQHTDDAMSREVRESYGVQATYTIPNHRATTRLRRMQATLRNIEAILSLSKADMCLIPGDVDASVAAAYACAMAGRRTVHIESGLRSHDLEMPEESNRIAIDALTDYHLCTERQAVLNLKRELRIPSTLVGNTMIPSLERMLDLVPPTAYPHILVTLHRPALVDDHDKLAQWVEQIQRQGKRLGLPVVWVKHPRVKWPLGRSGVLTVRDPMPPREFIQYLARCALVVTDSGGLQEEAAHLGIPCLTLRDTTERPVTLAYGNRLLDPHVELETAQLDDVFDAALALRLQARLVPLWDDQAGERAADLVEMAIEHAYPRDRQRRNPRKAPVL